MLTLAVAVDEEAAVVVLVVAVCNIKEQRTLIYHTCIKYIVTNSL